MIDFRTLIGNPWKIKIGSASPPPRELRKEKKYCFLKNFLYQITLSYGDDSNLELVRWYGFAVPENEFDSVEVIIPSISGTDPLSVKKKALAHPLKAER